MSTLVSRLERVAIVLFCVALIIISLVYANERIIFTDTVAALLDVLRGNSVIVTTNRYTSIFGQFLPLWAFRMGWSLQTIVVLYSLNLILIPVICSLLSLFWLRDSRTAWAILLFYTVMGAHLFYFPISEFQVGMCLLLLYTGIFERYRVGKISQGLFWSLSVFFIPTVVFSHPLSILVLSAWIIWQCFINRGTLMSAGIILAAAGLSHLVKNALFPASYDSDKAKDLDHFRSFTLDYLDSGLANGFYKAIRDDYFLVPVFFLAAVAALIYTRKYAAAILLPLIVAAFWVLITVTFRTESYHYYMEHMYQPICFMIVLAATRYIPGLVRQQWWAGAVILLAAVSVIKVVHGSDRMEKRLAWYEACFELMDRKQIKKTIIAADQVDIGWEKTSFWIASYETLVLSALKGREQTRSITIVWNEDRARPHLDIPNGLLAVGLDVIPAEPFPTKYFDIRDKQYQVLSDFYHDNEIKALSYR